MRACSGTWIAHGSGSADRDAVDRNDRVRVPPGQDEYTLRRLWLTAEEEQGYYYGFANEGLWPLCHVAHVRPVFRESDWQHYREVNQRFADAVVAEARSEDPVVLVQDYHFALLPAMVREQAAARDHPDVLAHPLAESGVVRHLPVAARDPGGHARQHHPRLPHALPLQELPRDGRPLPRSAHRARALHDLLPGRARRCVESYPISIEWPRPRPSATGPPVAECRRRSVRAPGTPRRTTRLAVGVDRFDYTKGILERLHAVERMLEKHPEWIGRFTFVQVAAPSRSALEEYRSFQERIDARSPSASTSASAAPAAGGAPAGAAPRPRARQRAVPRRRRLPGHQPARRHEPGVQGVRGGARRRAGRAGPEPLRRRRARDARGADRQSVPRGGDAPTRCTRR